MGGFAALIGGIGQGAQQYGNQVRGFLENRRTGIANQLLQEAGRTWDPEHRSNLLKGVTDLMSNVPMDKALTPVLKSYQTHEQGTQWHAQLGQAVQQAMPQPGPPQPGPAAVGQQPGTTLPADITAALPPLSPVAPEAQAGGGPAPAPNSPLAPPPQEAPPLAAAIGQPAQPAAAPLAGPIPQAGLSDALGYNPLEFPEQAYNILRDLPPGAREGMQQYLNIAGQRAEQLGLARNEMEIKQRALPQIIAPLEQMINNPNTSDMMRAMAQANLAQWHGWAVTPGATPPPNMMANMGFLRASQPKVETINVRDMDFPTRQRLNLPEGKIGNVRVLRDPWSGELTQYLGDAPANAQITLARDNQGNYYPVSVLPGQPNLPPEPFAQGPGALSLVAPGFGKPLLQTNAQLQNFITTADQLQQAAQRQGKFGGPMLTGGYPSYAFPSEHPQMAAIEGPGGKSQLVQVPAISRKQPIGAAGGGGQSQQAPPTQPGGTQPQSGGPTLPSGTKVIGNKPQAPHQIMVSEQQLAQENRALSQIQYLKDHANVFAGLIDAGKIELGLKDGLVQNILTRAIDYTPEQAAVVQAFNSLGESVGILRNALGGGFRSHDAFLRLQATKGSVMQNPKLTLQILDNLGGEFRAQAIPLARSMGGQVYGLRTLPPTGSLPEDLAAPQGGNSDLYNKLSNKYLRK